MVEHPEGEKETWNMAMATMKRLNGLLTLSSMYAQTGRLNEWFYVLMDMRRNLCPFLEEKEFEEVTKKLSSLPKGWNTRKTNFAQANKAFDEVYIIFIKCMKSKGLLMPKTKDAGKSIIDM